MRERAREREREREREIKGERIRASERKVNRDTQKELD